MITINDIKDNHPGNFVFFWGDKNNKKHINKTCLSQWYSSKFIYNGDEFKTAEHWMMYHKAKLFNNNNLLNKILKCDNPSDVKKFGREVKGFDSNIWDDNKVNIVINGNIEKFNQNYELKEYLLSTGEKVLVEASPYDKIWGIGLKENDIKALNPLLWDGENLLGFSLMEVRKIIKNE